MTWKKLKSLKQKKKPVDELNLASSLGFDVDVIGQYQWSRVPRLFNLVLFLSFIFGFLKLLVLFGLRSFPIGVSPAAGPTF